MIECILRVCCWYVLHVRAKRLPFGLEYEWGNRGNVNFPLAVNTVYRMHTHPKKNPKLPFTITMKGILIECGPWALRHQSIERERGGGKRGKRLKSEGRDNKKGGERVSKIYSISNPNKPPYRSVNKEKVKLEQDFFTDWISWAAYCVRWWDARIPRDALALRH